MKLCKVIIRYSIIYNKIEINIEIIFNNIPSFFYLFINTFLIICPKLR